MPAQVIVSAAILAVMVVIIIRSVIGYFRKRAPPDPLDHVLFTWNGVDAFTVRRLLEGICIFGRTGSGKSSSSGRLIARAIIGLAGAGGLLLLAKPEDLAFWVGIFSAAGRKDDLIVFSPDQPWRFNALAYIQQTGGDARAITKFFTEIKQTLRGADTRGGENADFFEAEQDRMIYNSVVILKLGLGRVTAPDIHRFILGAAKSPEEMKTQEWQDGFHRACLKKAMEATKTAMEEDDFNLSAEYWISEIPSMDSKTRNNILTGVMGLLHTMNTGLVKELLSGETNVSPDDLLKGKFLALNMSPVVYGDTGSAVCAAWKLMTQRMVLRRQCDASSKPVIIFADEAQMVVTSNDAAYMAQCRSHMGSMVYLTQSISSYYAKLGGETGKHQVDALMANFGTCIVHACDPVTAKWASEKVGRRLKTYIGTSTAPCENLYEEFCCVGKTSTSTSQNLAEILETRVLMNGLRTGGPPLFVCDGAVLKSGEAFSTGENYLLVGFSQKG